MLEYLRIRNLALIEDAELDFAPGMNVLTGETGAGKSFILKALGFLLGDRLGADMVRQGAEKAQVEAQFQMDGREIVIRRSLLAESGRSRLYVDDALRSQECVRSLREQLLAHASQHGQQQLLQPAFQARLMESTLKDPDLLRRRDELLEQLRSVEARRKELRAREAHLLERRDILEMQQQEIDRVAPEAGEEERLEEQRAIVRAAEQTREQYELALGLLHGEEEPGLLDMLGRLERCLHQMARTDDSVSEDADAVTALRQQLSHLSGRLRRPPLPEDMPDVEQMEERLYALAQLKRKLHRSLDEILELREEIRENISFLDACALDITLLDKEEKQLAAQLQEVLSALLPQRREAAADFARQLEEELRQLGFSEQVRVIPDFMPQEVWPGLMDEKVRILWAPNPGQAPQPLDRIASGGELSRFLLALMSVRPKAESATYIFDEVDAGVGGLTLNKLAEKLENLAKQRQMLVITHWPQLAARAQKHFQISKTIRDNATFTTCVPLDARQRHAELVRMAGGGQQGEALAASLEGRSYQLTMF
ncbi:DNA repair protein RecN [Desulfovibrio sp. SGI.082]|uniref:DNA repair protein RecN n=6 Tax=Desulfovibrio TaxID=872 RepID=A0A848CG02_9BACT|nr:MULTISPECIES: AAA family ATPase [Desulfovibrio]MBM6894307.1 AAA family ATPase [Desulfovibrio piger]MBS5808498.1 AAA family ATPase [Desulfovibrio piger]MCI7404885.1 AAA family ATPase [Desulfovibrio piger]MDD6247645.1 AAA family ATPase [Desulfovibrio piger]MDY4941499.1 AAA family ATPase [Desulfovibrio sp.]